MDAKPADPRFYQIRDAACTNRGEAARLISTDPEIIHARNGLGETALHFLVVENAFATVEWLRQNGSEIDPINNFGNTPLVEAAGLGYLEMCAYLVDHGANPRHICPNPNGTTTSAFSNAAQSEQIAVLNYLLGLLNADEDINVYFSDLDAFFISQNNPQAAEHFGRVD